VNQQRNSGNEAVAEAQSSTQRFWAHRDLARQIVARDSAGELCILGTIVRSRAGGANGGVSLVIAPPPGQTLTSVASLEDELSWACGLRVDVITLDALRGDVRAAAPPAPNPSPPLDREATP
jgi:predicted nucleotidyltransferase